jgi:hypothetical protein
MRKMQNVRHNTLIHRKTLTFRANYAIIFVYEHPKVIYFSEDIYET